MCACFDSFPIPIPVRHFGNGIGIDSIPIEPADQPVNAPNIVTTPQVPTTGTV
jgi:hypothetical protein